MDRDALASGDVAATAHAISAVETGSISVDDLEAVRAAEAGARTVVLGITGTGGAGKSSLTDELIRRLRLDQHDKLRAAVLAIDPTRCRGGGALLGDRIRMNCLGDDVCTSGRWRREAAPRRFRPTCRT